MGRQCQFKTQTKRYRTGSYDDVKKKKQMGLQKLTLFKVPAYKVSFLAYVF